MKTKFWKAAAAVLMGAAFLATSCVEKEEIKPSFPAEAPALTGQVGGTVEIAINPNLAWELSLSTNETLFWFEQDEVKSTTISGVAGETTVVVNITDQPSYADGYYCEVTLTMGGQSQVIATITVAGTEIMYRVYPAIWDEKAGAWKQNEDYDYVYAEEPVSDIELKYSQGKRTFMYPVKVVSELAWSLPAPEGTEWLEPVAETALGTQEVVLEAKDGAFPAGGATAEFTVVRADAPAEAPAVKLNVTIPDYRTVLYIMQGGGNTIYAESAGGTKQAMVMAASNGMKGVAFEVAANGTYSIPEEPWFQFYVESYDPDSQIAQTEVMMQIAENTGAALRIGGIALIPTTAEDASALAADGSGLAEGVGCLMIEQLGTADYVAGPVSSKKTNEELVTDKASFTYLFDKSATTYSVIECDYAYKVVQGAPYALELAVSTENYTYEVLHTDPASGQLVAAPADWWIKIEKTETAFNLTLDPITGNPAYADEPGNDAYEDDLMGWPPTYYSAYVVIKDAEGNVVAGIECEYNSAARFGKVEPIEIDGELPAGVTFTPNKPLDSYTQEEVLMFSDYGISKAYELKVTSPCSIDLLMDGQMLFPAGAEASNIYNEMGTSTIVVTESATNSLATYLLIEDQTAMMQNQYKALLVVIYEAPAAE